VDGLWATKSVQLISKISNLCDLSVYLTAKETEISVAYGKLFGIL